MKAEALVLEGTQGLAQGERFAVAYGCRVVIGRSRECDVCLRALPAYRKLKPEERRGDAVFLGISRRHLQITFVNSAYVEIENLGRHGSRLDGERLDRKVLTDLRDRPHTLQLGEREAFTLQWAEIEEGALKVLGKPAG